MAASDDLSPWLLSIENARKSHPDDKQKLLPYLRLCADEFDKDPRFQNDIRYLRVCLELAISSPDPTSVFCDLEKKQIGRKHASSYEVYATYLEGRKKFEDADAVYKLGFSRHAHPLERLKRTYNLFVERMSSRHRRKQSRTTESSKKLHGEASKATQDVPKGDSKKDTSTPLPVLPSDTLLFTGQGDQSFEELRLAHWSQLNPITVFQHAAKVFDNINGEKSVLAAPNISHIGSHNSGDLTMEIRKFAENAIVDRDVEVEDSRHHGLVEPTINTKEALNDILSMFSQPLDMGKPRARRNPPHCNQAAPNTPIFSVYEESGFSVFEDEHFETDMIANATEAVDHKESNSHQLDVFEDAQDLHVNKKCNYLGERGLRNQEVNFTIFEDKPSDCKANKENILQMNVFVDEECKVKRGTQLRPAITVLRDTNIDRRKPSASQTLEKNPTMGDAENRFPVWHKENAPLAASQQPPPQMRYEGDFPRIGKNVNILGAFGTKLKADSIKAILDLLFSCQDFHQHAFALDGGEQLETITSPNSSECIIDIGPCTYFVKRRIEEQKDGCMYQAYLDEDTEENDTSFLLKVCKPACIWEFYVHKELEKLMLQEETVLFTLAKDAHVYSDCSVLVFCNHGEQGSLQDVLNMYHSQGQEVPEAVCLFYTIEMLRMLQVLNRAGGCVHGNISPKCFLLRNHSSKWESWAPNKPGCWKKQGLTLADWSQSFFSGKGFEEIEDLTCTVKTVEGGSTVAFQADFYGLSEVVHALLYGKPLQVKAIPDAQGSPTIYLPTTPFKENERQELWQNLFLSLLNMTSAGEEEAFLPQLCDMFETYLDGSSSLKNSLHHGLMRQNIMMRGFLSE